MLANTFPFTLTKRLKISKRIDITQYKIATTSHWFLSQINLTHVATNTVFIYDNTFFCLWRHFIVGPPASRCRFDRLRQQCWNQPISNMPSGGKIRPWACVTGTPGDESEQIHTTSWHANAQFRFPLIAWWEPTGKLDKGRYETTVLYRVRAGRLPPPHFPTYTIPWYPEYGHALSDTLIQRHEQSHPLNQRWCKEKLNFTAAV